MRTIYNQKKYIVMVCAGARIRIVDGGESAHMGVQTERSISKGKTLGMRLTGVREKLDSREKLTQK